MDEKIESLKKEMGYVAPIGSATEPIDVDAVIAKQMADDFEASKAAFIAKFKG